MGYRCTPAYRPYRKGLNETTISMGTKIRTRGDNPIGSGVFSVIERGKRAMRTKMATKFALALGMPLREAVRLGLIERQIGGYPPQRPFPATVIDLAARRRYKKATTSSR